MESWDSLSLPCAGVARWVADPPGDDLAALRAALNGIANGQAGAEDALLALVERQGAAAARLPAAVSAAVCSDEHGAPASIPLPLFAPALESGGMRHGMCAVNKSTAAALGCACDVVAAGDPQRLPVLRLAGAVSRFLLPDSPEANAAKQRLEQWLNGTPGDVVPIEVLQARQQEADMFSARLAAAHEAEAEVAEDTPTLALLLLEAFNGGLLELHVLDGTSGLQAVQGRHDAYVPVYITAGVLSPGTTVGAVAMGRLMAGGMGLHLRGGGHPGWLEIVNNMRLLQSAAAGKGLAGHATRLFGGVSVRCAVGNQKLALYEAQTTVEELINDGAAGAKFSVTDSTVFGLSKVASVLVLAAGCHSSTLLAVGLGSRTDTEVTITASYATIEMWFQIMCRLVGEEGDSYANIIHDIDTSPFMQEQLRLAPPKVVAFLHRLFWHHKLPVTSKAIFVGMMRFPESVCRWRLEGVMESLPLLDQCALQTHMLVEGRKAMSELGWPTTLEAALGTRTASLEEYDVGAKRGAILGNRQLPQNWWEFGTDDIEYARMLPGWARTLDEGVVVCFQDSARPRMYVMERVMASGLHPKSFNPEAALAKQAARHVGTMMYMGTFADGIDQLVGDAMTEYDVFMIEHLPLMEQLGKEFGRHMLPGDDAAFSTFWYGGTDNMAFSASAAAPMPQSPLEYPNWGAYFKRKEFYSALIAPGAHQQEGLETQSARSQHSGSTAGSGGSGRSGGGRAVAGGARGGIVQPTLSTAAGGSLMGVAAGPLVLSGQSVPSPAIPIAWRSSQRQAAAQAARVPVTRLPDPAAERATVSHRPAGTGGGGQGTRTTTGQTMAPPPAAAGGGSRRQTGTTRRSPAASGAAGASPPITELRQRISMLIGMEQLMRAASCLCPGADLSGRAVACVMAAAGRLAVDGRLSLEDMLAALAPTPPPAADLVHSIMQPTTIEVQLTSITGQANPVAAWRQVSDEQLLRMTTSSGGSSSGGGNGSSMQGAEGRENQPVQQQQQKQSALERKRPRSAGLAANRRPLRPAQK